MAEAFGIAAGVAGFVSLVGELGHGIDKINELRKQVKTAPVELVELAGQVKYLQYVLTRLQESGCDDPVVIMQCESSCRAVSRTIEHMSAKLKPPTPHSSKLKIPTRSRTIELRHWKEDVQLLQWKIGQAKSDLNIALVLSQTRIQISQRTPANALLLASTSSHTVEIDQESSMSLRRTANPGEQLRNGNPSDDLYTPFSSILGTCDDPGCTAIQKGFSLRVALTQLGIPFAATVKFHFAAAEGQASLHPALKVERVVKYTSPGFQAIWKFERQIISIEETRDQLVSLSRSDPTFMSHVILSFFAHLSVLKNSPINSLEVATTEFESMDLDLSDRCCSNMQMMDLHQTKTFINAINRSFPATFSLGPIHSAISHDDIAHLASILQNDASVIDDKDFMGRTPLHVAIYSPRCLELLLEAGYATDVGDAHDLTPLYHAITAKEKESTRILLLAGARALDNNLRCLLFRTVIFHSWSAEDIVDMFSGCLKALPGDKNLFEFIGHCLRSTLTRSANIRRVSQLYSFLTEITASFFHQSVSTPVSGAHITSQEHPESVNNSPCPSGAAFAQANHPTLLMEFVQRSKEFNREIIPWCIGHGLDVDHCDGSGQSSLHLSLQMSSLERVLALLNAGASASIRDSALDYESKVRSFTCMAVWISLLLDHGHLAVARAELLQFIRHAKFEELGMTHICQYRGLFLSPIEDVDEILDEEEEFVDLLESEMLVFEHSSFDELLATWKELASNELKTTRETALASVVSQTSFLGFFHNAKYKRFLQYIPHIDYHKDECGGTFVHVPLEATASRIHAENLVSLIKWIEYEYWEGTISTRDVEERDKWYTGKISLVEDLVQTFDVSVASVKDAWKGGARDEWKDLQAKYLKDQSYCLSNQVQTFHQLIPRFRYYRTDEEVDADKALGHFLETWKEYQATKRVGQEQD
ncbi:ankyrin [Zalerion maritima]|uniref:Ankyrin n=1 Tax=Zalerion maritima TaxID=339359 RepID=A0AAD5RXS9_9PEZI|nr:ankyrin [Zalerion maritima]